MKVGTLRMSLMIQSAHSLKDKRRVVKSLKDRIRNNFNVSIAEIDSQDVWQRTVLGVAIVSTDGQYIQTIFSQIINFVQTFGLVNLIDYEQEIF